MIIHPNAPDDPEDLLDVPATAEACGVSEPTVRFWIRARIAATNPARLGPAPARSSNVWRRKDVEAWRDQYRPLKND
jgi:predicted DNA-binding transcriptional regulator AlpA